jgi:D-alanine-D-alanine ligase-like ATP-grasp enzyme
MNSSLEDRLEASEVERHRVNDKWLKLVARQKVDEKNTKREREGEQKKELVTKELDMIKKKNEFYERENKYLREQMTEIQAKLAVKTEKINDEKRLREEVEELRDK